MVLIVWDQYGCVELYTDTGNVAYIFSYDNIIKLQVQVIRVEEYFENYSDFGSWYKGEIFECFEYDCSEDIFRIW